MARKKRKLKSKTRLVFIVLLMLMLFTGGFVAANNYLWPLLAGDIPVSEIFQDMEDRSQLAKLDGMTVLMMGVDEREKNDAPRTDSMILAHINNKENRIALLSIPRDTKVRIPGYGVNKINVANVLGGPQLAKEIVSDITGVKVDYYVTTNFNGFQGIVDALDGVTVEVDKNMSHSERAYGGAYNFSLQKGVQRLNGEQALGFVRYRNDALGDITRTQRQLKLLTAIGEEAMQPSVVTKLPKLVPEIYKNVDTDMGLKQMLTVAKAAKNIENVQLVSQTLPGWFLDENGASYWYVEPSKAKEVANALFKDGKVVDFVLGEMSPGNNSSQSQMAMEATGTGSKTTTEKKETRQGSASGESKRNQDANDSSSGSGSYDRDQEPEQPDQEEEDDTPPPGYYPRPEAEVPLPDPVGQQVQIIISN